MKEFNFWWLLFSVSFAAGAAPGSWIYDDSVGGGAILKRAAPGSWMYADSLGGGAVLKRALPSMGGMWNSVYRQRREPNDKWGEFWGENAWKRSYPGSFRPGGTSDLVGVYKRLPAEQPSQSFIAKYKLPEVSMSYKRALSPYGFLSSP